ncbi:MAG: DNA-directed RNA polymerase subunit beta [Chitinophagales bacterium]|jgi:DNA-directed RNA polymerase subunit beta|nr:DNA-directed RNA polymerase subunit beta [Chitinophagales bacterium]
MQQTNSAQRINFGKVKVQPEFINLLDIQKESFKEFFQIDTPQDQKHKEALYGVFQENFPISDARNMFHLEFLEYFLDSPRYTVDECVERGLTYSAQLKAKMRLSCNDEELTDFKTITQEVYLGSIPYMTSKGTFIINGAERVIVTQLHRSPSVFFGESFHPNGSMIYSARVIPFKGAWMEFATDINNVMYAYIDRKKKFPVSMLLRAIGYDTDKDILDLFQVAEEVKISKSSLPNYYGRKLAARLLKTWIEDFVDEDTGEVVSIERNEVILERDTVISEEITDKIIDSKATHLILQKEHGDIDYSIIFNTLNKDTSNSEREALTTIYRHIRGVEAPDDETAKDVIDKLFFSDKRYDLGEVGRHKINQKLGTNIPKDVYVLTKEDIVAIVKHVVMLVNGKAEVDDIDHLSNRRVRTVGEQLYAQFSLGLQRLSRTIKERMNQRDNEVFTPTDLINARSLNSVINSFFGTSQLSQFLDQTNPLSEITNKRRISALGPGGLSRERAGFEVRDVHYSHYGRLCTIETPEGPNIGLISTLCCYAKINHRGFIETPYIKVNKGVVDQSMTPIYMSAEEEDKYIIAQAKTDIDAKGKLTSESFVARKQGDFPMVSAEDIEYIDIAPNQILGVSASLIPFLEHDDANRALMGSNMQRQAVPLIKPQSPIVGTGFEAIVAQDSMNLINAEADGEVVYVDSERIDVRYDMSEDQVLCSFNSEISTYKLQKFSRTNQGTCINLKPIVTKGQRVSKGQVLCEGFATNQGELALGQNLKVAFMPWKGYNFEDAIVISERVIKEDVFTSIHIEEYDLEVRDTKLGEEELTSDIPNVSEDATKDLNINGVIRIGARVKEGDILVGKVTPKGETDPTPEEKLLRAIFGDKAGDVKDASLKAPPSTEGIVINTKIFRKVKKDSKKKSNENTQLDELEAKYAADESNLKNHLVDKLQLLINKSKFRGIKNIHGDEEIPKSTKLSSKVLSSLNFKEIDTTNWTEDTQINTLIQKVIHNYQLKLNEITGYYKRDKYNLTIGDELPNGVLQLAKVQLAVKRKLKVGDKLAGRHGNKGIVAKIVKEEDMPFLDNGEPIDIVLNPLGVPSRMNLGQVYETVLGWAGKELGVKFATPVLDGASMTEIKEWMNKANLPYLGSSYLYDGETGERFMQKTTVGVIYMLKLSHMIDDKMHARSTGPYSLITQQPLGGKAQFGGQRFGEMEVWAIEAYGASNILRELMTIKSDDIQGRAKAYEAIVKGENIPLYGIPESFNVLVHELRGLALDIKFD